MEVVYRHCAGLDVHKKSITAHHIIPAESGGWQKETGSSAYNVQHRSRCSFNAARPA